MQPLPENSRAFFEERFEKVIFKEDFIFVERLKNNAILRNSVYPRLDSVLNSWQTWEIFLTLVVDCAGLMHPDKTNTARESKKKAEKLKQNIIEYCENLANSIDELNELGELGFIDVPYSDNPIKAVIKAGEHNYLFNCHIKENLQKSIAGFCSSRYIPSIQALLRQVSYSYEEQQVCFSYNYSSLNNRASPRDFCVKLSTSIDEFIRTNSLPKNFKLTQSEIADFCNALLLDEQEKFITADNVKTYINDFRKLQQQN